MNLTHIDALPILKRPDPDFPAKVDDLFGKKLPKYSQDLNSLAGEIGALAQQVSDNKNATSISANTASSAASAASASEVAAADAAKAAAAAAANTGAAPAFVSGTNYAKGAVVFSMINLHTYRARTSGVRNIDPANDLSNWLDLQPSGARAFYLANL